MQVPARLSEGICLQIVFICSKQKPTSNISGFKLAFLPSVEKEMLCDSGGIFPLAGFFFPLAVRTLLLRTLMCVRASS